MNKILKNKYFHLGAALLVGLIVGSLLKDTKSIEESMKEKYEEKYESTVEEFKEIHETEIKNLLEKVNSEQRSSKTYREDVSKKVNSLTTENRQLRQKITKKRYKLIKPDGTIIEKEFEESDTQESTRIVTEIREEFSKKVSSIENKWKKKHIERIMSLKKKFDEKLKKKEVKIVEKIKIVEKEKLVKINERKFRPELGITSDRLIYVHATYPIWGPIFVGSGVSSKISPDIEFGEGRIGLGLEW